MFCLFVLFINQGQPLKCYLEAATRGALCKKVFLEISQNSRGNACASLFFNKNAGLRLYFKKRLWHRSFPVNASGRLLLVFV